MERPVAMARPMEVFCNGEAGGGGGVLQWRLGEVGGGLRRKD